MEKNQTETSVSIRVANSIFPAIEQNCNQNHLKFFKKKYEKIADLKENNPHCKIILGILLTKVSNLAGIKGSIAEINKKDVLELILYYHSHLSLEDIYLAFKLERYNMYQEKINHYQIFNAQYVSEIIKNYKKYKQKYLITNNINVATPPKEKIYTEKEKYKIMEEGVTRLYEIVKQKGSVPEVGYVYIYDFLKKNEKIKELSEDTRKEIIKLAKKNIKQPIGANIFFRVNKENEKDRLINECKRIVLENYLKNNYTTTNK